MKIGDRVMGWRPKLRCHVFGTLKRHTMDGLVGVIQEDCGTEHVVRNAWIRKVEPYKGQLQPVPKLPNKG